MKNEEFFLMMNGVLILQEAILILYLFQQRRQINRFAIGRNGLVKDGHFLKLDVGVEGSLGQGDVSCLSHNRLQCSCTFGRQRFIIRAQADRDWLSFYARTSLGA